MIGTTLGHYRILEVIGAGGMGVVYKGEDTRLGRPVAVKALSAEVRNSPLALERFRREARAASGLNHPSICVVHDIGEDQGCSFIVMELLEGQPLTKYLSSGPMALGTLLRYAIQVADALETAHASHVLHRDVKPGNIFITTRGIAKLLDFGLAKVLDAGSAESMATLVPIDVTHAGTLVGTISYMSPEQVRGRVLDARTDIFSFGVTLYEMTTGQQPFTGQTSAAICDSILHAKPKPPDRLNPAIPADLQRVVLRALEKDRRRRFQDIGTLRVELQAVYDALDASGRDAVVVGAPASGVVTRPATTTPRRTSGTRSASRSRVVDSVAVLPFVNGGDADAEYLSDGLTESVIYKLSGLAGLRVVPRATAFRYKDRDDLAAVARELKVRAIVTGRVVLRGDTLLVQADLCDPVNDAQLWGERYVRRFSDVFAVQEEMATAISMSLQLRVTGEDRKVLARRPTNDSEAYQEYLKGRYYWNKRTLPAFGRATVHFQQAIDRDPTFVLAHVGLADTFNVLGYYNGRPPLDVYPRARAAAMRALEVEPDLAEAHASLGYATLFFDRDWPAAEAHFKRALALNSSYASAHQWYGWYLLVMGRFDEMVREMRTARELDPLSLIINDHLAYALSLAGEREEALAQIQRTLELEPGFSLAHLRLGLEYHAAGRMPDAIRQLEDAVALSDGRIGLGYLGQMYGVAGRDPDARAVLRRLTAPADNRYVSPLDRALVHDGLGEPDEVFGALDAALAERTSDLVRLRVLFWTAPTRSDPRFAEMLARVGLPREP